MLRVKMVNLKRRKVERERGVTLIELMLVVGIMGIVLAATYNMFDFQQKSYSVQDNVAVMQQNVRVGLEYMVREIRMAGYIPEDIPFDENDPPDVIPVSGPRDDDDEVTGAMASFVTDGVNEKIEEATADSITIQADVDDDGASEVVRYTLGSCDEDASIDCLKRETWKWDGAAWNDDLDGDGSADGPQVIAEDIDTIAFSYALLADDQGLDVSDAYQGELKDWDLAPAPTGDGPLNTNALRSYIRQVEVTLTARAAAQDSRYIHPQQGDHYRRRTLTSRIGLRNMK